MFDKLIADMVYNQFLPFNKLKSPWRKLYLSYENEIENKKKQTLLQNKKEKWKKVLKLLISHTCSLCNFIQIYFYLILQK